MVESVKAASDVYAPVAGEVVDVNDALAGRTGRASTRIPTAPGCSGSSRPSRGRTATACSTPPPTRKSLPTSLTARAMTLDDLLDARRIPRPPHRPRRARRARDARGPRARHRCDALIDEAVPAVDPPDAPLDAAGAAHRSRGAGRAARDRGQEPGLAQRTSAWATTTRYTPAGDPAQRAGEPRLVHAPTRPTRPRSRRAGWRRCSTSSRW